MKLLPLLLLPILTTAQTPSCPPLHLLLARASTEPPGPGFMSAVAHLITQSLPSNSTTLASVSYPATFTDYAQSQTLGVHELRRMILSHSTRCPASKIALLGFSQGGHVIMDVLCGRGEDVAGGWEGIEPLGGGPGGGYGVVAVVTFGDPSHSVGGGWGAVNRGTSGRVGIFPRGDVGACEPYTSVIREWCDDGDEFCDSGADKKVHAGYFFKYMGAAAEFVVGRYNATVPEVVEPTVSAVPSATAVPEGSTNGAGGLAGPGLGVVVASGVVLMRVVLGM